MNLKRFATRSYSFGVSRIDAKKVHVGKVYWMADLGRANPGPSHYNQKPHIGLDTPKYSMSAKSKQIGRMLTPKVITPFIVVEAKSFNLPGPGSYQHKECVGPIKATRIDSVIITPN